ncbi:CHAT domain-containing protein [Streptomyces yunnanensis]|uniref:CHAT domain-containing protein n=1 Tax=Streptomyces yunnanensis TaxID=156453 RepID=A0ABY8A0F7_9ACTN|nr:CHAT domain-containing protein [Streptomyces yunnanensis]WEB38408.1 CHAT domain-containing protein [Streptomyces yunnanensis]
MTAHHMAAEDAARRILERVERVDADPDALRWFLGPEAAAAVEAVRADAVLPDGSVRALALYSLAYADWCRYLAGDGQDRAALGSAVLSFAGLGDLGHLPPVLRPLLDTLAGRPAGAATDPSLAYEAGVGASFVHQQSRHPAASRAAETLLRHATAGFPAGSAEQGTCLSDLGLVLVHAYRDGAGPEALTEGVQLHRAAVAADPVDQDEQARRHGNLGFALRLRASATKDPEAARESVAVLRTAVRLCSPDTPNHLLFRASLGSALATAALTLDDPSLLPEAIDLLRAAAAAPTPTSQPAAVLSDLGLALIMRAMEGGDDADLYDEAIATCRRAADAAPNPVERAVYLTNLGLVLEGRALRTDRADALADAYAAARDAVDSAPSDHPVHAQACVVLAGVLRSRNTATGRLADLDEAVALARRAFETTPSEDRRQRVFRGTEFADLTRLRALATRTPDDLAEPIALLRDLAGEVPEDSAERAGVLFQLARCLTATGRNDGHIGAGRPTDIDTHVADEANDCFRACLALPPPNRTFEAAVRFALGMALAGRAGLDAPAAWQEGADEMRRGIALLPADDLRRSEYLSDCGSAHLQRAADTGTARLYEEGLRLLREALACAPRTGASERAVRHSNLGAALATFGRRTGDIDLLAEAVRAHRAAVVLTPPDDHFRVHRLGNLGDALQHLAEVRSDRALLTEAVEVLREAVTSAGPTTPSRPGALTRLGHALRSLTRFTGDRAPLREAIQWHREACTTSAGPTAPGALLGLANGLMEHYYSTRDERIRTEALEQYATALAATPASSDDRFLVLTSFGHAAWGRAADTGDEALMDAAIDRLREAAATVPTGHAAHGNILTNLAVALIQRAQITGDRTWQEEGVAVARRAVDEGPPDAFDRAGLLNNLAEALSGWYDITGDTAAADEAATLLRTAMARDHGERLGTEFAALNLGLLLQNRAFTEEHTGAPQIAEARQVLETAVAGLGPDHPWRSFALTNLAAAHLAAAQLAEDATDPTVAQSLHRSVTAARQALDGTPDGHPDQARAQWVLASAQMRRALLGERVDLEAAAHLARQSGQNPASPLPVRLLAARTWGEAAAHAGWESGALDGYAYAVELLPHLAPRSLARTDQEDRLRASTGLASDAAALALRAGDPARALALLEQGRGVLLAQSLENRTDASRLRAVAPALAAEFEDLREHLSAPARPLAMLDSAGTVVPPHAAQRSGRDAEARHALARRWDELLAEIRALPGFADFLRPPALPHLLTSAADGPVVVLNVSAYRSDALLLTADAGIEVLPLPGLDPGAVLDRAAAFIEGVDEAYGEHGVPRAVTAMRTLTETLEWLWDTVAAPVLDRLGLRTVPDDGEAWPRVWWCPTGWLSFLPLHAAGRGGPDSGTWVLDRAVSSYTPTVRALLQARSRLDRAPRSRPAPLVVALAETPGGTPLPGASREAALLADLFPAGRFLTGPDATVEAVGRALAAHSWVHFSCHGVSELLTPSDSGLILHDGRLTAFQAAAQRPGNPELAVLSACSTSQGGITLPDEAVQLASSFQLAGYPHVIGTLWTVSDKLATHLMEEFYAALCDDLTHHRPLDPASALHHPLRSLRDRFARAPHLWAAHIHTGA